MTSLIVDSRRIKMRSILIGLVWQNGPEPVPLKGMVSLRIKVNASSVHKVKPWEIGRIIKTIIKI